MLGRAWDVTAQIGLTGSRDDLALATLAARTMTFRMAAERSEGEKASCAIASLTLRPATCTRGVGGKGNVGTESVIVRSFVTAPRRTGNASPVAPAD
jgi:hypothetical protein